MTDAFRELLELGLISWCTLLVGWQRDLVTRRDIQHYASCNLNGSSDPISALIDLLESENLTREEVSSRLRVLAGRDCDQDSGAELRKWQLGSLRSIAHSRLSRPERLTRLEEMLADFEYPPELQGLSHYHVFALRGRGEPLDDPEDTMRLVIARLERELLGSRE